GRIAAMVGGDHQEIAIPHQGKRLRQPGIERLKRCSIACNIAAVAEIGVEVHEVCKDEVTVTGFRHGVQQSLEHTHVVGRFANRAYASLSKDVSDFSNGMNL